MRETFNNHFKMNKYRFSFAPAHILRVIIIQLMLLVFCNGYMNAQTGERQKNGNGVTSTFKNPVLPGDHPDQTLLKVGNDFYTSGSSFHFNPYVPILHSTDLVHWKMIARAVPSNWSEIGEKYGPKEGIWQGALAYFNNSFWVFYSLNTGGGQYFSKASNPAGHWSAPVRVNDGYGYDNSVFVDEDGRVYMLIKSGQRQNRIRELSMNGQLIGKEMNMDWVNKDLRFSWAEGPVMCKRNGRYYYFPAGDVSGGQYVLSSPVLTADESSWTIHGSFWPSAGNNSGFNGPNHISAPVQLADGTWWVLSHSYENGWEGQGRQGLLHQVHWDANGVPQGVTPSADPLPAPNLPSSGISYNFPKSDDFESTALKLDWHFFNTTNATKFSLTDRPGYMRLKPRAGTTHILQKDGGKNYSLVTKIEVNAIANGEEAGLRMMNGFDNLYTTIYSGYSNGKKKIGLAFNGAKTEVDNALGDIVWLKIERAEHEISGFYSSDGKTWKKIGTTINNTALDKSQPDFNGWVGNSIGLYATGIKADFDQFLYLADLPE
jgi:xylan 1,4-beta-xylosidase